MARRSEIEGMRELERALKELGKVPQTVATKSARAGGTIARNAARENAPVDEGNLKAGIIMKQERRVKRGKSVYDIMMDPAKNELYERYTKDGTRYYYPASMEYGFMTVDGRYVPGYRFLRRALTENVVRIEKRVMEVAIQAAEKALKKRG